MAGNDHFAVIQSKLYANVITIHNGLNLGLNNWLHQITDVLKWTKLNGWIYLFADFRSIPMVKQNLSCLQMWIAGSFQSQSLYIKKMGIIVARWLALSWVRFLNQKL